MVGATRFANHSCRPNCRYNIADVGRRKVIKLEMLLPIKCGDEITVFYSSEDFFGNGNVNCLCPHTDMHAQASLSFAATQEQETFPVGSSTPKHKRRRIFVFAAPKEKNKNEMRFETLLKAAQSRTQFPGLKNCAQQKKITQTQQSVFSERESSPDMAETDCSERLRKFVSSSQSDVWSANADLNVLPRENQTSLKPSNSSSEIDIPQSTAGADNFSLCVHEVASLHGTSDAEASSWVNPIRTAFPGSNIPSYKTMKRRYALGKKEEAKYMKKCAEGNLWCLNYMDEIKSIVEENFDSIRKYAVTRSTEDDIRIPNTFENDSATIIITLVMNSDGVRIINSGKQSLWPVWLAIANLPPIKRCMFRNIILARLWFGKWKPCWDELFKV